MRRATSAQAARRWLRHKTQKQPFNRQFRRITRIQRDLLIPLGFLLVVALLLLGGTSLYPQVDFNGPEGVVFDSEHNRYLIANWNTANIVQRHDIG